VGQVFAKDIDKGENAVIDYEIIDGNDGRIFGIQQGTNNQGIITVDRRLDREMAG
jgi:hypothetical protein